MLLAIDVGNTNIVLGALEGQEILFEARLATDYYKTSDQYGVEIGNILDLHQCPREKVTQCIISSVVPPVFNAVKNGITKLIHTEPLVVGPGIKTGMNIQMDAPNTVGSDLIVAAVGACADYAPPLILVDMGTATTVTVVGEGNTFLGGCIIPGVRVAADALSSKAAQLPGIQLDRPTHVIGKNTVDCMRSGIMYSAAGGIESVIGRMEEELGYSATVILTGGIAPAILPLCNRKMILRQDLILKGLAIIHQKNQGH